MSENELRELRRAADKNGWRLDALDRWREVVDRRVSAVESRLAELDDAARIARAVAQAEAKKVSRQRASRYSVGELVVGAIVAASAVGSLLLQLVHVSGHG